MIRELWSNFWTKMTWPRAALLAVMVATVVALSVADAHLAYARFVHQPASFVGVVEIPADPSLDRRVHMPEPPGWDDSVAGALLAGDTWGDDDDGILNMDSAPQ